MIKKSLIEYKKSIFCLATGGGKSVIFSQLLNDAIDKGTTVLVITESKKLFSQIQKDIKNAFEIKSGCDISLIINGRAYISMAQTLIRRKNLINQFFNFGNRLLIISDEIHISTAAPILRELPNAYSLGVTATPDARFAKHLPELFNDCIVSAQPDELVQMGFLSPYYHFMRVGVNEKDLKLKGGEFTEESQKHAFEKTEVFKGLIEDLNNFQYRKCIIFCSSIAHCKDLVNILREALFNCIDIHSENSDAENAYNMHQYRNGDINICVSVGVLTKGFDFPEIDLVILQRATTSLPLYLQMIGRGSRIAEGKSKFTVLDYGLNGKRLGLWDAPREWETMWKNTKKSKDGVAPTKECPECYFLLPASATICENCGHKFIKVETEKEKKETVLIELTNLYNQFRGKRIGDLSAKELAAYAKLKGALRHCERVARYREIEERGFIEQFAKEMGYKPKYASYQRNITTDNNISFSNIIIK